MNDQAWKALKEALMSRVTVKIEGYDEVNLADSEQMAELERKVRRDTRPQDPCYCESGQTYADCCLATGASLGAAVSRTMGGLFGQELERQHEKKKKTRASALGQWWLK